MNQANHDELIEQAKSYYKGRLERAEFDPVVTGHYADLNEINSALFQQVLDHHYAIATKAGYDTVPEVQVSYSARHGKYFIGVKSEKQPDSLLVPNYKEIRSYIYTDAKDAA
jgi:hypothetical protein